MMHSNKVLLWYTVAVIFLFAIIFVRFAQLMLSGEVKKQEHSPQKLKVVRGSIYDRNGKLLANQIKLKSLDAWLPSMKEPQRTAQIIAPILGLDLQVLQARFQDPNPRRKYMWVKRFLSERETKQISSYIERGELSGLTLRNEYKRYYPLGELGAHLLGFTDIDSKGLAGVELSMESWLSPDKSIGQATQATQAQSGVHTIYGNKVFLSIDLDTQYIIDKISRKTMNDTDADGIIALLMDARTGALVAFVNLPEYDPNLFNRYPESIRRNQAISIAYEPGSVFKIYTMASMLDLGAIDVNHIFNIGTVYNPQSFQANNIRSISDITPHGPLSATEVLIYSSNVGMATASEGVSAKDLYYKLRRFGFGSTTGIQLLGESNGILKKPSRWSIRTKPTISFGQEIGVSAIQMVRAATVFTNGGVLLAPIIIDRIEDPNGNIRMQNSRKPEYEVISPITAQNMLLMMEQVVASDLGTMRSSRVEGLRISGKSGTAQVINPATGEYYAERVNSSAIAIFPTDDPRFILYVNIFNPKGTIRYGGRLVSPMVARAVSELTTHYNLPLKGNRISYYNEDTDTLIEQQTKFVSQQKDLLENTNFSKLQVLPDLRGISKRNLLSLMNLPKIQIQIIGEGHVVEQSLAPGTAIWGQDQGQPKEPEEPIKLTLWLK